MEPLPIPQGGDVDRGPQLLAMFWTEAPLAVIFVALRIYSRLKLKSLGLDDWTMFITLILFLACIAISIVLIYHGGQRHLYYLSPAQREYAIKLDWISQPFNIISLATGKISVALFLLRLLGPSAKWRKWFLYASILFSFLFASLTAIFTFAQCNPPRALWEGLKKVPQAKCWHPSSQLGFSLFYGSYNCFMDLALALLPISLVWNLKLEWRRKVALFALLGLGVFASICSAIKTSVLPSLTARADFTWATHNLFIWAITENFVLIVCGCIPTLKPVYDIFCTNTRSAVSLVSRHKYGASKSDTPEGSYNSRSGRAGPAFHAPLFSSKPTMDKKPYRQGSRGPNAYATEEMDSDDRSLLELGKINVVSGWEVRHEQRNSAQTSSHRALGNSVQLEAIRDAVDRMV